MVLTFLFYSSYLERAITSDRSLVEKGNLAFMSFIRSYKEHELKYIFEYIKVDIGATARSFFLLQIP